MSERNNSEQHWIKTNGPSLMFYVSGARGTCNHVNRSNGWRAGRWADLTWELVIYLCQALAFVVVFVYLSLSLYLWCEEGRQMGRSNIGIGNLFISSFCLGLEICQAFHRIHCTEVHIVSRGRCSLFTVQNKKAAAVLLECCTHNLQHRFYHFENSLLIKKVQSHLFHFPLTCAEYLIESHRRNRPLSTLWESN